MIKTQKNIHKLLNSYFRASIPSDTTAVASKLRQEDCDAIKYMTDLTPGEGLKKTFECSLESYTIVINGVAEGMFGICGTKGAGQPWLLMSDWLLANPHLQREFLVETHKWISSVIVKYKKLFNFFPQEHTEHKTWVERVGFEVMDLYPEFGPYKKPFYYFEMKEMN